jgi:methylglyoxal reductase
MRTTRLPGTDVDVSVVGHGCWAAGGLWWGDDVRDDDAIAAMRAAADAGVNLFDTAPLYGHGHADTLLRQAFGAGLRDLVVASKCGVRWDGDGTHARSDLTPAYLRADIDASLQRLGIEHISLMQVHWPCELGTPIADTMSTLFTLRDEGKIGAIGLCNYSAQQLAEAREHGLISVLQTPYSMLRRELEGPLAAEAASAPKMATFAYEPLCRGLLTGRRNATDRFPDTDLRARDDRFVGKRYLRALTLTSRLALIAARHAVPTSALAVAWVLRQPAVDVALVGAKRPAQVLENVVAGSLTLDDDVWREVDRIAGAWHG